VRPGLFGVYLYIEDHELSGDLETFTETRLRPLMEAWAPTFQEQPLGPQFLVLPMGVMGAVNSRFEGVAMRCVLHEHMPIGDRDIPSRMAEYYDIADDLFKTEPCSMALSFWVHTPDADVILAPHQFAEA